jgi:hypothetical protein
MSPGCLEDFGIPAFAENQYALTFVEEKSRKAFVRILKTRDEVGNNVLDLMNATQKQMALS